MSDKVQKLKNHKIIATGLFIVMAMVYFLMVYLIKNQPHSWMYYVKAFSEAAMVGALADWFAVTALFKYPLGLKIPHTNLIEKNKNSIGDNLGDFVTDNFLTTKNIRPYVENIDLAQLISDWLKKTKNQQTLEAEISSLIKNIITNLDDTKVSSFLSKKAEDSIKSINFQNIVSQGLNYAIENDEHNKLINLLLPDAKIYIENNREEIYQKIIEKQPILALVGGKTVTNQLIGGIISFLDEILENNNHRMRLELTDKLLKISEDIKVSEEWEQKLNSIVEQFISPEKINNYVNDFWNTIKQQVFDQLNNPESLIRNYIHKNIIEIATNLNEDDNLKNKINKWVQHSIYKMIINNTNEVANLISKTVANWDGKELSDKLELEVGKDLQFIRINGTLVGGLVGVIIYIITQFIT